MAGMRSEEMPGMREEIRTQGGEEVNMVWIRRDRENGKEEEVTEEFVQKHVGRYAMLAACEEMPASTCFADYYPRNKKEGERKP